MEALINLTGTAPLLMNNARTANPLDKAAKDLKALTGKRNKTDQDHAEIFRVGHAGSLYHDSDIGPYLPGDNIWRSLHEGAKKHRLGKKVEEGVLILNDINPLGLPGYKGGRDIDSLWAQESFRFMAFRVTGTGSRRIRVPFCRPIFREWKTEARLMLDDSIIDLAEFRLIAETAGARVGLGDWRPKYGRYTADVDPI